MLPFSLAVSRLRTITDARPDVDGSSKNGLSMVSMVFSTYVPDADTTAIQINLSIVEATDFKYLGVTLILMVRDEGWLLEAFFRMTKLFGITAKSA